MPRGDHFLADSVRPHRHKLTYMDGFRFGLGFAVAGMSLGIVFGVLAWVIILGFNLR